MHQNRFVPPIPTAPDKVSRLRDILTECNFLINLVEDQEQLLNGICHLMVDSGDFSRAWIRLSASPSDRQPAEHTPPDKALPIRKDCYFASSNPARRSTMLASQDQPGIELPLKDGQATFGALTLYGANSEPFDEQETRLLAQLAANLSIRLLSLRDKPGAERPLLQPRDRESGQPDKLLLRQLFERHTTNSYVNSNQSYTPDCQ